MQSPLDLDHCAECSVVVTIPMSERFPNRRRTNNTFEFLKAGHVSFSLIVTQAQEGDAEPDLLDFCLQIKCARHISFTVEAMLVDSDERDQAIQSAK